MQEDRQQKKKEAKKRTDKKEPINFQRPVLFYQPHQQLFTLSSLISWVRSEQKENKN